MEAKTFFIKNGLAKKSDFPVYSRAGGKKVNCSFGTKILLPFILLAIGKLEMMVRAANRLVVYIGSTINLIN